MSYSIEFKKKCVEMYWQGIVPEVPEGISREDWDRREDSGEKHKLFNKVWSTEEKIERVARDKYVSRILRTYQSCRPILVVFYFDKSLI